MPAARNHRVVRIAHRDLEARRSLQLRHFRDAPGEPGQSDREPYPENFYEKIEEHSGSRRQHRLDRIHRQVRAAPVSDRDGEEHDPDVTEDLELLAPRQRLVEDEGVEDLQQAHHAHRCEDRRDAILDAAVDPREQLFHQPGVLRIWSSSFSAPNSFASSSCACSAALTSGAVSISFTFMPSFFTCASASPSRCGAIWRTTLAASFAAFCSAVCSAGLSFFHSGSENTRKVGSMRCLVSAMQQATSFILKEITVAAVCSKPSSTPLCSEG